ncbi:MAG: NAD(P)-dependent oxidoreductase [Alphaproteobacteria bacterium]
MPTELLRFVDRPKATPEKRATAVRRADFDEIYRDFAREAAAEQSARCSQCGVPFCQVHCPLHNNIPDWLKLTAEGRLEEAYEVAAATNTFPEICGRICPQDRLCEGNCVIEKGFSSVTIGAVERYITEQAFANGWVDVPQPRRENGRSVGIVGGGPAGLAAAEWLRRRGYRIDVYDRHDRVGGLLVYGIPNFKLEKHVVARRVDLLARAGIGLHPNTEIGRDLALDELRARHDAVLLACGVYKAREIQAPGVGLSGVVPALDFLIASNRKGLGDAVPGFDDGTLDARDKDAVVVGGGDTAMDCVRTAVRQGAKSVTCLYRRDRANMPGSAREVGYAEEEGVRFQFLSTPAAFLGEDGVHQVRVAAMRLGAPDAAGRASVQPAPDGATKIPGDLVIKALGFDPEDIPGAMATPELRVTRWGTLEANHRTLMTSVPGVFAAGDIVRGGSLVVWAIRDGRDAAKSIDGYLDARAANADALYSAAAAE